MLRLHREEKSMRSTFVLLLLVLAACATMPAVDPGLKLRPETRSECVSRCDEMGLRLSAIVLISNRAGCVCESAAPSSEPEPAAAVRGGTAAVSGGALVAVLEAEEAARHDALSNRHLN
jgi:hypothetical protein